MQISYVISILSLLYFLSGNTVYAYSYTDKGADVEIVWDEDDIEQGATKGVKISEMKRKNRKRLLKIIKKEMKKYPDRIMKGSLKKIYMVKKISVNETRIGGYAKGGMEKAIYLSKSNDSGMKSKFHHEMAHILFYRYGFEERKEWEAINPTEFRYIGSGMEAIRRGYAGKRLGKKIFEQGFISAYAQSSVEEDMAELAEHLFRNDRNFKKKLREYDKLEAKTDLLKKFYKRISHSFLKYFRGY